MGEDPLHMFPMSVLFLRSSALMLLVSDHWNKENEMVSRCLVPTGSPEVTLYEDVLRVSHTSQCF